MAASGKPWENREKRDMGMGHGHGQGQVPYFGNLLDGISSCSVTNWSGRFWFGTGWSGLAWSGLVFLVLP